MCAKMKDSHTLINAPAELANEIYARPLMRTRLIEDKVLVVNADSSLGERFFVAMPRNDTTYNSNL